MNSLLHVVPQVLQPSTNDHLVADGELSRSAATSASTDPTAPRQTPLAKAIEARGYQCAYFVVRDLAATKAHLLSMEGWQKLMRVRDYLGWRYNTITLGGSEFDPGAWRSR
jgi:hypothetical protein